MSHTNRFTRKFLFIAIVAISVGLSACGNDGPSSTEQEPDFDFSGDLIAFSSYRDGQQEIYLMTPNGSKKINISKNPASDADAAWSSDGSKIAFSSDREGQFEIYVMKIDGSNIVVSSTDSDTNAFLSISYSLSGELSISQ